MPFNGKSMATTSFHVTNLLCPLDSFPQVLFLKFFLEDSSPLNIVRVASLGLYQVLVQVPFDKLAEFYSRPWFLNSQTFYVPPEELVLLLPQMCL